MYDSITVDNFDSQHDILAVVHSDSCPDCVLALDSLKFLPKDINIRLLNFDTEIHLCDDVLKISIVPYYLYIKNGKVHSKMGGLQETKTVNAFAIANKNNLI